MSLPTKPTSGKMEVSAIRWLLYGPPKIGKTSLASGFPGAIFAATEKGYKALKVYKKDILTWEGYKDFVDEMVEGDHDFRTAVIDTADILFDKCSQYVCDKLGIEHESEGEWGRGWTEVKKEFMRVNNTLFQSKYGIIFLSHTKSDTITSDANEVRKMVPTLSNQARKILLPLVDTIGLMRYKTIRLKDSKGKVTGTEDRLILSFKGTEEIEAGDRTGLLPPNLKLDIIPDDKKTPDMVAKYAKKNYERIAQYYK